MEKSVINWNQQSTMWKNTKGVPKIKEINIIPYLMS